ncbi:hypothetical protein I553_2476 [Mycobacterium xenopi 4042]|uniref:Uncharacterized protein n=1 Tax=Mycobacterium xenopi 4042 TaxID=1299334 RepID=X8CAF6_MYCXE|nr:hypothetical protein I553_2476 [Mycobacterium xenopi 4042]
MHHLLSGDSGWHIALVVARMRELPSGQRGDCEAGARIWRTSIRPRPPQPDEWDRVRGGAPPEVQEDQIARLLAFAKRDDRLRGWRTREYPRLASRFDPLADVPLRLWQAEWPPSLEASVDAFTRLLGRAPDPSLSTNA